MEEQREDPEKILHRIQEATRRSESGKLKVYLGAAPGVGKTYAMLQDALEQRAQGVDVIVGVVETHGRKEISALLQNFEVLPKKWVFYREKKLLEFDLDGALQRNPGLILMDEMAHTNIPGLRHEKRWQDIKELLDRGINVHTTLNVQHIESLNDKVSQLIHVPIKETIPDVMLELATTIELVDLPPDELLQRLEDGKVYFRETAQKAKASFFRKINLIALRELALRVAAEHVGAEGVSYRKNEGVKEAWSATDHILVCVSAASESLKLIRVARQLAFRFQTQWMAIYVASPDSSEKQQKAGLQNLRFAEGLGAKTHIVTGSNIAQEIIRFAHENNVTLILIRKRIQARWKDFFSRRLADKVVKYSGTMNVYVVTESLGNKEVAKTNGYSVSTPWYIAHVSQRWKFYLIAFFVVGLTTLLGCALYGLSWLSVSNILLLYFLDIVIIAALGWMGPAVFASILSVLLYSSFFIESSLNFGWQHVEYVFTLVVFLIVAQVISRLTLSIRQQRQTVRFAEHQRVAVYDLNQQLSRLSGNKKILEKAIWYLSTVFDSQILALVYQNGELKVQAYTGEEPVLTEKEKSIAHWVYSLGQMAGLGTNTLPFSDSLYVPLLTTQGSLGVLKIHPFKETLLTPEQINLLEACAKQIGLVLEADSIHERKKQIELQTEIDRVRNALLQYVSQDIQVPLELLFSYLSTIKELNYSLNSMQLRQFVVGMHEQVQELERLLNTLFQITDKK